MIRQIAVASGKGGAGKTSLSAALSRFIGPAAIACDADVDAANAAIALGAVRIEQSDYYSGQAYSIDPCACSGCGRCQSLCHFGAPKPAGRLWRIDEALCERCAACTDHCPSGAIIARQQRGGEIFLSKRPDGGYLVHAELLPGEDTSGKLVHSVRQKSLGLVDGGHDYIVIDAPPGIGCPLIAAVQHTSLVVVVVEASRSGIADADRLFQLLTTMNRRHISVINKAGFDPDIDAMAEQLIEDHRSPSAGRLVFDKRFQESSERAETWADSSDPFVAAQATGVCMAILNSAAMNTAHEQH